MAGSAYMRTATAVSVTGFTLLSLALGGCKKEAECEGGGSCIELRGRVGTAQNSAVPLGEATIELSSIGNGSGLLSGSEVPIKQVTSKPDGSYTITFRPTGEMQQRGSYRLYYSKEGYGREAVTQKFYENIGLAPGSSTEQNLHLPQLGGQLRIVITGFPPDSATTSTYTTVASGKGGRGYIGAGSQSNLYATGTTQVVGSSNTTDVSCSVAANEYAFIRIYKLKAGVPTTTVDSIYCPVSSTVTYTHAF